MRPLLTTFLLAALATAAQAQTRGVTCHTNADYLVIVREKPDDVGSEFLVRKAPAKVGGCQFKPAASDYRLGRREPYHFLGLGPNHLVVTASTGPAADLVIFDLAARRQVLSERLTEADEPKVEGDKVSLTLRVGPGNPKDCPAWENYKKDGGSGELGTPSTFDLATGTLARGTTTVCTYAQ